jgi:hypothetical protein
MLNREGKCDDAFTMVAKIPHITEVMAKNTAYYLYERAKHVFGEAKRVHDFAAICRDEAMEQEEKISKLG